MKISVRHFGSLQTQDAAMADGISARAIDRVMQIIRDQFEPLDLGDTLTIKTLLLRNRPRERRFRDAGRTGSGIEAGHRAAAEARASVEAVHALQQANRRIWP